MAELQSPDLSIYSDLYIIPPVKKLIFLFLLVPFSLFAHPHIMLNTSLEIEYSNSICTGVWVDWKFDRFFSVSIIREFDKDKNGKFDKNEVKDIEANAFSNLKNYGYFVNIRVGKKRASPKSVTNFSARFSGDKLYYRFFVPLDKGHYSNFYISIFDPTYYSAVTYVKGGITFGSGTGPLPEYKILVNKNYPVYYNPYGSASDMTAYKKWKPGLQTAYPKEVHVYFQ